MRRQLARVLEAHRGDELGDRMHRVLVVEVDALGLVRDDQSALELGVLRRHSDRAGVGVAALGLDAADREHERARGVAPVRAERQGGRDRRSGDHLAAGPELDLVADPRADERVVDELEAFQQREAHRVGELLRRRAGAAFAAVDDDEVDIDAGLDHRLDDAHELARLADADLEADRLAAAELAQLGDQRGHLERRRERGVVGRREHGLADLHQPRLGDLLGHLRAGEDAAVTGLGALGDLDLDHLDLRVRRVLREQVGIEAALGLAAPEVAGADLPDQVAAAAAVVARDPPFARVVGEVALLGAGVHGEHRVAAQRAEAHRRDVQHRERIRLCALLAADGDPQVVARIAGDRARRDRVLQERVARGVDVLLGAERLRIGDALRALVDDAARVTVERPSVRVALDEVLMQLGARVLQDEPQVGGDRVIAQDAVPRLRDVPEPEDRQRQEHELEHQPPRTEHDPRERAPRRSRRRRTRGPSCRCS